MIRAVFFDLDGTLLDVASAWRRCVADYLDRHGQGFTPEDRAGFIRAISGALTSPGTFMDQRYIAFCLGVAFRHRGLSAAGAGAELVARFPGFIEPDPAILRLLGDLSVRYQTAIITNGSRRVQRTKIERAGLAGAVGHVFISGELGVRKPEPGIFLRALAWAGVGPEDALMVGDSPSEDIGGAKRLGLRTCEVKPADLHDVRYADWTIGHVTELAGILP